MGRTVGLDIDQDREIRAQRRFHRSPELGHEALALLRRGCSEGAGIDGQAQEIEPGRSQTGEVAAGRDGPALLERRRPVSVRGAGNSRVRENQGQVLTPRLRRSGGGAAAAGTRAAVHAAAARIALRVGAGLTKRDLRLWPPTAIGLGAGGDGRTRCRSASTPGPPVRRSLRAPWPLPRTASGSPTIRNGRRLGRARRHPPFSPRRRPRSGFRCAARRHPHLRSRIAPRPPSPVERIVMGDHGVACPQSLHQGRVGAAHRMPVQIGPRMERRI